MVSKMTVLGWIILSVSWGATIIVMLYCYFKLLKKKEKESEERLDK